MVALPQFITDFAKGIELADALKPVSKKWQPGIGPHDERDVVRLVMERLSAQWPVLYGEYTREKVYPQSHQACDLCLGSAPEFEWAIEFKPLRMLGDNGDFPTGRDDVSKILSPFAKQRSALTDCTKLVNSGLGHQRAIVIYAYEWDDMPTQEVINLFEYAASKRVRIGERHEARFRDLIHPVHQQGTVYGWELIGSRDE
jgi:hypothetical protein